MRIRGLGRKEAAARVKHFVSGSYRLAISSQTLAELLGLVEPECRRALEAMAARGLLHKDELQPGAFLYCKL